MIFEFLLTVLILIHIFLALKLCKVCTRVLAYLKCIQRNCDNDQLAVSLSFLINGQKVEQMNLKVTQTVAVEIVAEDHFDNVVVLEVAPAWSLSDPSLGTLEIAEGGMSVKVVPSGRLGACQLQALVEVAGKSLSGSLDLVLMAGDIEEIILKAGTPV